MHAENMSVGMLRQVTRNAGNDDDVHQVVKQLQPANLPFLDRSREFFRRTPPDVEVLVCVHLLEIMCCLSCFAAPAEVL